MRSLTQPLKRSLRKSLFKPKKLKDILGKKPEVGILLVLLFLIQVFTFLSPDFLSWSTWGGILTSATEIGIMALGATMLMTCGEFDLSVGSTFALSGMVFASLTTQGEQNSFLALFIALLLGCLIGLINGWLTLRMKIPSFIATLGSMLFWRGIVLVVTDGFPITALEASPVMELLGKDLGNGIHSSLFLWPLIGGLFAYLLHHHPFGNWVMATGGHEGASFSMGIQTQRVKMVCFVLSGLLGALAGVIQFSHLEGLSPTAGEQYELRSIAIAVIGGTSLAGGRGTIWGTFIGTLILGTLNAGLVQAGVATYWFRSLVGVILVLAVLANTRILKWSEKTFLSPAKG